MKYVAFRNTDLRVSPLCLGTVNYGTSMPLANAKKQLNRFMDAGGNFIDTAHVYGDWEPGIRCRSERVIGEWIRETKSRDNLIIATKGAHPPLADMKQARVNPSSIEKDLTESLEYLHTEYVDLYFLHRDDPSMPVSVIIDFLSNKVREGKIRYYGCSNWSLPRIREAAAYAQRVGTTGFVCNQLMWSLANINFDHLTDKSFILMDGNTYAYHTQTGLNAMAYMSIAKGYFARRIAGEKLEGSVERVHSNPINDAIYERMVQLTADSGLTMMDICLLYFRNHPFIAVPIASFDNDRQLEEGMRSLETNPDVATFAELHAMKNLHSEPVA